MAVPTALHALKQAIEQDETVVTVADLQWEVFLPAFTSSRTTRLFERIPGAELPAEAFEEPGISAESGLLRRLSSLSSIERDRELVQSVRELVAVTLGHDSADTVTSDRAFRELGIDSLTALELRNQLNILTGLRLPATIVFDHPTPASLASYLRAELFPEVAGLATPSAVDETDDEAQIRAVLADMPLARLRDAGLLGAILALSGGRLETESAVADSSVDDLDAEGLIRMAFDIADS